jgi:hypothetical protein
MSAAWELQQSIWSVLDSALSVPVYDHVDEPDKPPYVVVGEDTLNQWDTKSTNGFDALVTLHVWSRYRGREECKSIQGDIYDAMHNQALSVSGYNHVLTQLDLEESFLDDDGLTRHGISRYRVVFSRE